MAFRPNLIALTALCVVPVWAWAQADAPLTVAVSPAFGGQAAKATIKNETGKTVTASVLSYELPMPAGSRIKVRRYKLYDCATEPLAAKPMPPAAEAVVPLASPNMDISKPPILLSVIFSDGTSWGDSSWAERISRRRDYMEKHLWNILSELRKALSTGAERETVIEGVRRTMESEGKNSADHDEAACIRASWGVVLNNFEQAKSRTDGMPVPTSKLLDHALYTMRDRLIAVLSYGAPLVAEKSTGSVN